LPSDGHPAGLHQPRRAAPPRPARRDQAAPDSSPAPRRPRVRRLAWRRWRTGRPDLDPAASWHAVPIPDTGRDRDQDPTRGAAVPGARWPARRRHRLWPAVSPVCPGSPTSTSRRRSRGEAHRTAGVPAWPSARPQCVRRLPGRLSRRLPGRDGAPSRTAHQRPAAHTATTCRPPLPAAGSAAPAGSRPCRTGSARQRRRLPTPTPRPISASAPRLSDRSAVAAGIGCFHRLAFGTEPRYAHRPDRPTCSRSAGALPQPKAVRDRDEPAAHPSTAPSRRRVPRCRYAS
jgi:hypothetical protein